MDVDSVMFASLVPTTALFGLALAVAWARFGRPTHVALWSAAFFAYAVCNLSVVASIVMPSLARIGTVASVISSLVSASLFSHGVRQRAGLTDFRGLAIVTTIMIVASAGLMLIRPDDYHNRSITNICDAVLYALAAQALRADPHARGGAARATYWLLTAFAGYIAGLSGLSLFARPGGLFDDRVYGLAFLLVMPAAISGLGLFSMLIVASDLSARLQRLASLDPLTGVLNRRGMDHAAGRMFAQCRRFDRPFTIVVADLDRFKAINDRFGHALGDLVLQRFAAHCEATVREGDLVGRLGGEEFVVVLADASPADAAEAMERLRAGLPAALADLALPVPVTASFGIATLDGRDDTLAAMLVRADGALYGAKGDGRDRIIVAPAPVAGTPGGTDPRFLAAFAGAGAEAGDARARPAYGRRS